MAKISALPLAGPITGNEMVPLVQAGKTRQSALSPLLANLANPHIAAAASEADRAAGYALAMALAAAGTFYPSLAAGADAVAEGEGYFVVEGGTFYTARKVGGVGIKGAELLTVDSVRPVASIAGLRGELDWLIASNAGVFTPEQYGYAPELDDQARRTAVEAARDAAMAQGGYVLLSNGTYDVGTSAAPHFFPGSATYVGAGLDPCIRGAVLHDANTRALGSTIMIDFDNGTVRRRAELSSSYRRPYSDKSIWLAAAEAEAVDVRPVAPASMRLSFNDYPGHDDWAAGPGAVGSTGIGFAPDTNLRWHAATIAVHGGMEIDASITGQNLNRGVVALCTHGAFGFYASDAGIGTWFYKPRGEAVQTGPIDWDGRITHASWQGRYAAWTLRFYDHRTIGVLLNGTEVYRYELPQGHIVEGGFIAMQTQAGATAAIESVTATRHRFPQGGTQVRAAIYGDSKSAPYHGAWSDAFREALDGAAGVRVVGIANHAVSGQNSDEQLAVMTANPPAGCNHVFIGVGTNDIQAGTVFTVTVEKVSAMIDLARQHAPWVHILVPDLWYSPAQADGFGEVTLNYQRGAATRGAILNLAATKGCSVINLPKIIGPTLGCQIIYPDGSDPRLRDAIHPTLFTYRLIGQQVARSVLRIAAREMRRAVPLFPLAGTYSSGWAAGNTSPSFRVAEDGWCDLSGTFSRGTIADGTVIFTLPANLRPRATVRHIVWIGGGESGMVEISAINGQMTVYGVAAGITLCLDGIGYQTASLF